MDNNNPKSIRDSFSNKLKNRILILIQFSNFPCSFTNSFVSVLCYYYYIIYIHALKGLYIIVYGGGNIYFSLASRIMPLHTYYRL